MRWRNKATTDRRNRAARLEQFSWSERSMASATGTRDEAEGAAETAARDPLAISPEVKASLNLLIVDDDRTLREGCASVLQLDGYNVTTLGRGDEAIDLVKRRRFDIILVDLYMTPVSGMEILKATLASHKDTIV